MLSEPHLFKNGRHRSDAWTQFGCLRVVTETDAWRGLDDPAFHLSRRCSPQMKACTCALEVLDTLATPVFHMATPGVVVPGRYR